MEEVSCSPLLARLKEMSSAVVNVVRYGGGRPSCALYLSGCERSSGADEGEDDLLILGDNFLGEEYWRDLFITNRTGVTSWSTDLPRNMELVWRVQEGRVSVLKGGNSMVEVAWLMVKDTLERVCPSDLRASLPASVKESDWEKIGGSSGIMVVPWEAISFIASSWGVFGVEQRKDSSEAVMGDMRGMEVREHLLSQEGTAG